MLGLGLLSMFVALSAAGVILWLPLLVWRLIGNRRSAQAQPVCAMCLYPTTTVTTRRCHECGADLVHDGVITPSMRVKQGGGVLLAVAAWTLMVSFATLLLVVLVGRGLTVPSSLVIHVTGQPASGAYRDFTLRGVGETTEDQYFTGGIVQGQLHVTLRVRSLDGAEHTRTFIKEPNETFFRIDDGRQTDDSGYHALTTEAVVKEVLIKAGAPPDAISTEDEAVEIAHHLLRPSAWWGGLTSPNFAQISSGTVHAPKSELLSAVKLNGPLVILSFGAASWLAGTTLLFSQHAKRFRPKGRVGAPSRDGDTPSTPALIPE